ncbi:hypothetical protein [Brevundimonas fluminis]|uniref:hypothetical protein n=1 Tax=Brevundimonas fluminis TaxID=2487274 RepID=UPI000F656307|nr:hypothetical protein [Brevundimonas fluminis]
MKGLIEVNAQLDKAELKARLAEIYTSLADTKIALADAQAALAAKDAEIARLTTREREKPATVSYRGYTFGLNADGTPIGRPYCPVCEQNGRLIQLVRATSTRDLCPSCKAPYNGHPWQLPKERWPSSAE